MWNVCLPPDYLIALSTVLNQAQSEYITSTCSHFAFVLCCHSNKTCAPTANPPNSAQLEGIPYHSTKLHPVVWECGEGQTDTQMAMTIYILPRLCLKRNVTNKCFLPYRQSSTNCQNIDLTGPAPKYCSF